MITSYSIIFVLVVLMVVAVISFKLLVEDRKETERACEYIAKLEKEIRSVKNKEEKTYDLYLVLEERLKMLEDEVY